MNSVLMSVQPQWLELITRGEKPLEVRKSQPKIPVPFKVYLYCTKGTKNISLFEFFYGDLNNSTKNVMVNGTVVAEFICDRIQTFEVPEPEHQKEMDPEILEKSCLTYSALHRYASQASLYGWYISELKIYDKPKELSSFSFVNGQKIKRPPQSWCYVKDIKQDQRRSKLYVKNPGGNASAASKQYRVSLPTKWIKEMGLSPEERTVKLSFDGRTITIRKSEVQETQGPEK